MGITAKGGVLFDDSSGQKVIYDGPVTITPESQKAQIVALASLATADATDLPTAITLANATKARLNLVIAALKA